MRNRATIALLIATIAAETTIAVAQSRSTSSSDPNRLICRRLPDTGSLVSTRRQCFTKAEWDRIAESARTGAEKTISGLAETSQSN